MKSLTNRLKALFVALCLSALFVAPHVRAGNIEAGVASTGNIEAGAASTVPADALDPLTQAALDLLSALLALF